MDNNPLKIVLMVALVALASEVVSMAFFHDSNNTANYLNFLEPLLLILVLSPILYFFVYKPMQEQIGIQKELLADRDILVAELRKNLEVVGSLRETMLICSNCSNVRDKSGQWHKMKMEQVDFTQTSFRKGMCLDCLKSKYPEQYHLLISKKVIQSA